MSDWDGKERRREMYDVILAVKSLEQRFDNELGSANGVNEGSVKRHLRKIQESMEKIEEVVVGDGKDQIGLGEQVRIASRSLKEHAETDDKRFALFQWVIGFIAICQGIGIYKMFIS